MWRYWCNSAPSTNPGLYSESTSWISADELELLDSASLWVYSSYNTYTCGVNVRYLTLNTDGHLYINAKGNTNNSFTYVLYVAYQVNFTKCLYMFLYSPLDAVASITNSSYFKNAVNTAPIEGYDAVINRVKTGKYGDNGEDLYRKEYELSRLLNVTYNSNGGTGTMNSEDVKYNGKLTLPACTFTAPVGKQFKGWAYTSNGDIIATATITLDGNKELYAIWEDIPAEQYTVTFNSNGGSGTMAGVQYAGTYTLPACTFTAPAGKEFDGWALSANGEKITTAQITISENTELFALWKDVEIAPETKGGLSAGAVVAIVLAVTVVGGIGGFAVYWFVIKKKTWAEFVKLFKKK